MADEADIANDYAQRAIDVALYNRPMMANGKDECDCGEPISEYRKRIGAVRCIHCQTRWEKRNA